MPYTADKPSRAPSADELRPRIPGWGADLDPADRPAVPREQRGHALRDLLAPRLGVAEAVAIGRRIWSRR